MTFVSTEASLLLQPDGLANTDSLWDRLHFRSLATFLRSNPPRIDIAEVLVEFSADARLWLFIGPIWAEFRRGGSGDLRLQTCLPIGEIGQVIGPRLRQSKIVEDVARHDLDKRIKRVSPLGKLIPWVMKGGLAVADQGLVTGSNFVMNVLLARWLRPEQYGAFAVVFAAFTLVLNLYQSLITEPMSVFGCAAYRDCLRGYLRTLLWLHVAVSFVPAALFGISAGIALKLGLANGLPSALAGVACAAPLALLLLLAKRAFYLQLAPAAAAGSALLYCALTIGGLAVAYHYHLASALSTFLLMGLGALGASTVLLGLLNRQLSSKLAAPSFGEIWRRHWRYGRWALASAVMMWIPTYIYYPLLSSLSGMAMAGQLKALMNFAAPVLQGYGALITLLLSYAAGIQDREGLAGSEALTRRITWLCVFGAVAYWCPLLLFKEHVFRLLYSGGYLEVSYLLPVVALGNICWCAFIGPATALRAMESPASVFAVVSVSSCASFAIGVPAIRLLGLKGAVWAMTFSEAMAFIGAIALFRRKIRSASKVAPTLVAFGK